MSYALTPSAPGAIGRGASPMDNRKYLIELGEWLGQRRAELDELDAAAQKGKDPERLVSDIALGMALWQAIKTRYQRLLAIWDGGRVGPRQCEELANLTWGKLDEADNTAASGLSLPEACKLSDALTGQLRQNLMIDPSGSEVLARTRQIRAGLERIRDQLTLTSGDDLVQAQSRFQELDARLSAVHERSGMGADVGGLLGPLENDTARLERDLIVGVAKHQKRQQFASPSAQTAVAVRDRLAQRKKALDLLAQEARGVPGAPDLVVPDVAVLGSVPEDEEAIERYLNRMRRLESAMEQVEQAYKEALTPSPGLAQLQAGLDAIADAISTGLVNSDQKLSEVVDSLDTAVENYRCWLAERSRPGE